MTTKQVIIEQLFSEFLVTEFCNLSSKDDVRDLIGTAIDGVPLTFYHFGQVFFDPKSKISKIRTLKALKEKLNYPEKIKINETVGTIEYICVLEKTKLLDLSKICSDDWILISHSDNLIRSNIDLAQLMNTKEQNSLKFKLRMLLLNFHACARIWRWESKPILQVFTYQDLK